MDDTTVRLKLTGNFVLNIGTDQHSQVVLPIAGKVRAMLKREGDRLFLKTERTNSVKTTVNHAVIKDDRWLEVTRYDDILIGNTVLSISPRFFLGRDRVGLDTTPLKYILPGKSPRTLLDGPFLRAKPGTFTAILGPAGSGKTIFLNLINGYMAPSEGRISIAEYYDPHRDYQLLRDFIGYVPQDDTMIPELTVRQSLSYRLGLKFPDMRASIRNRLIEETCQHLGFTYSRMNIFLDTIIGSAESNKRGLSGGERKRANIAHELITRPLILILDEPTSGLSSKDADQVVDLLSRLAHEDKLTIIATIHQPSTSAFNLFDDLMVLGYGGKLNYYGTAESAERYFETETKKKNTDLSPSEFIIEQSLNSDYSDDLPFILSKKRENYSGCPVPLESAQTNNPQVNGKSSTKRRFYLFNMLSEWLTLLRRNFAVFLTDKATISVSLAQIPIIVLMIFAVFLGSSDDTTDYDLLAKTKFHFDQSKAEFETRGETIPHVEKLWEDAEIKAQQDDVRMSVPSASRFAAIYFALVAASIWMGTLGSCREIVGEQHILKREVRTCVHYLPYLGAKSTVHVLLTGLQSGMLVLLLIVLMPEFEFHNFLLLWTVLWLVSLTSSSLGLLVSCMAPTQRVALTVIPLLMIPQLLFGGILRPPANISSEYLLPHIPGLATIQYWGFHASLETINYTDRLVLKEVTNINTSGRYSELNIISYEEKELVDYYFIRRFNRYLKPIPILFFTTISFWIISYITLRCRFSSPRRRAT